MKNVTANLKNSSLEIFEGADHSFKSGKREFIPELSEATTRWIQQLK
jgi:hypothetical protein